MLYTEYGKLRPYLNKYWQNDEPRQDVICSSEFFVFDTNGIDRAFFMEVLSSPIIQKQLSFLYSGARMPRINENDFMSLKIPFPPYEKQRRTAEHIAELRMQIKILEDRVALCRERAGKQFEEAVFGGA